MSQTRVTVIGGGFSGLATSALLARKGFAVTLLEKNHSLGGRAMSLTEGGYQFDMGPSWYLMPEVFEAFFALFGKSVEEYYSLHRLDPAYRVFFPDQTVDISASLEDNFRLFDTFEPNGAAKLREYLKESGYLYSVAMQEFIYRSYQNPFEFFNKKLLMQALRLPLLGSLAKTVGKKFSSSKAQKILQYTSVFLGADPANTPALYSLMAHVDFELGVWYPRGGMIKVVDGFERLCREEGVTVQCNTDVRRVAPKKGGGGFTVLTNQGELDSELVVHSGDYPHFDMNVAHPALRNYSDRYWQKRVMAPSAMLFYIGLSKKIERATHHNLFIQEPWEPHFRDIFQTPQWPEKPSYYFSCTSKSDPETAPPTGENLFILVPVAPGLDDSSEIKNRYSDKILAHLEQVIGQPVRENIQTMRLFSQSEFANTFYAHQGTALGLSHTLFQTAFFRPSHRNKQARGLYYTGQYTHPGIGVPMTIISAQILAGMIEREHLTAAPKRVANL
jgi:phytoene desaturase